MPAQQNSPADRKATPGDAEPQFDTTILPASQIERVSPLIRRLIAPNASPYTFTGTCTYVVGSGDVAVIDPGPANAAHIDTLLAALDGERIAAIVVSHTHRDHSPGAALLKQASRAPIIGCAPIPPGQPPQVAAVHDMNYSPDLVLDDGAVFSGSSFALVAVSTPGHASNHLCFALPEEKALFSGDHVMGWSTTIVAPPDGSIQDYMASLEKLRQREDIVYWPGHGGPIQEPQRFVRALAHRRRQREAQILERLAAGDETAAAIARNLYRTLDPRLMAGAEGSVFGHLVDLSERGLVTANGPIAIGAHFRRNDIS